MAGDGFLASRGMPEAKPAGRGRKLVKAVAVQAPEAKPSPVQIGPSQDAPESGRPEPGRTETPRAPHGAPPHHEDGSPRHQPRRGPTAVRHHRRRTDHDRPSRPRPSPGGRPGRGFRPVQAGARRTARGSVPFSARLSTASTRHIRDGRVEAAEPDRTNLVALTDSRATRREAGRANARSGEDASKAKRPNGREPPMDARRPVEALHLASTGMAGRGSKNTGTCPRTVGERGLTTGGGPLYGAW